MASWKQVAVVLMVPGLIGAGSALVVLVRARGQPERRSAPTVLAARAH